MLDANLPPINQDLVDKYETYIEFIKILKPQQIKRPTLKQYVFTKHYMETQDMGYAYEQAGYNSINEDTDDNMRRIIYWRVLNSAGVQLLLKIGLFEWALQHSMSARNVASRLLKAVDTADTVKEQISAIRELNAILGYHKPAKPPRVYKGKHAYKNKGEYHKKKELLGKS